MTKVLVIDDNEVIRSILGAALEHLGYRVTEAVNGYEGIKVVEADPPDLVLTDIIMPEQDGLQTIVEMRRRFPTIRIIAISGGGAMSPDDLLRVSKKLGASGCLIKPFTNESLRIEIERVLGPRLRNHPGDNVA